MIAWIGENARGNQIYLFVAIAAVLLSVFMEGRKKIFVIPAVLISVLIANPGFRYIWEKKLGLEYYWRIVWIVPAIPLCSCMVSLLAEKTKAANGKGVIALFSVCVIALTGTYMYNNDIGYSRYVLPASNTSKLPQPVVDVADELLQYEDNPRIVAVKDISIYIRQYTAAITTLFGRDIDGYILGANSDARKVNSELSKEDGDYSTVAQIMLNNDYKYLVVPNKSEEERQRLKENGFSLLKDISGYDIYEVSGTPTVIRTRNELGQVISEVYVDEKGIPVNNKNGNSKIRYSYDNDGNISRLFRTDTEGNGTDDGWGRSGYERKYDKAEHVILDRTLGPDGVPVENDLGYAEIRRVYQGKYLIQESFFDRYGEPVMRKDSLYSFRKIVRNHDGKPIRESYFDSQGSPCAISKGYAEVRKVFDGKGRILQETYFDSEGRPAKLIGGYSGIAKQYDQSGNLVSQRYLDENGDSILRTDGYAEVRWISEEGSSVQKVVLYDLNGQIVPVEGKNLAKGISSGWSDWMIPKRGKANYTFNIGDFNLGERKPGDTYTCQLEIEFSGVLENEEQQFGFRTQGSADGKWNIGNIWNSKLIKLQKAPENGIYFFTSTGTLSEEMAGINTFNIGFRCDNWAAGMFRVRNVKIERGETATEWTPGI